MALGLGRSWVGLHVRSGPPLAKRLREEAEGDRDGQNGHPTVLAADSAAIPCDGVSHA